MCTVLVMMERRQCYLCWSGSEGEKAVMSADQKMWGRKQGDVLLHVLSGVYVWQSAFW